MLQWFTCDVPVVAFDVPAVTLEATPELYNIYSTKKGYPVNQKERLNNP